MKRYFLTRSMREKALLVAFVSLASLAWLLSAVGRGRVAVQDARSLAAEAEETKLWLGNKAAIEAQAAKATAQLDPARTLNGARLVGELNALAGQSGLAPEVSGLRSERTSQFNFHSVQVSFRRADVGALVKFYEEVSHRSPYIALEQLSLATDRGAPGSLNATFRVFATELQR